MTTEAQVLAYSTHQGHLNLDLLRYLERGGLTYDEWFLSQTDTEDFGHAEVDTFRVHVRWLREAGHVKDSGVMRLGLSGHKQTVWELGDDRDKVRAKRVEKLRKLADALGFYVVRKTVGAGS